MLIYSNLGLNYSIFAIFTYVLLKLCQNCYSLISFLNSSSDNSNSLFYTNKCNLLSINSTFSG